LSACSSDTMLTRSFNDLPRRLTLEAMTTSNWRRAACLQSASIAGRLSRTARWPRGQHKWIDDRAARNAEPRARQNMGCDRLRPCSDAQCVWPRTRTRPRASSWLESGLSITAARLEAGMTSDCQRTTRHLWLIDEAIPESSASGASHMASAAMAT
jgi:hypothetical protein